MLDACTKRFAILCLRVYHKPTLVNALQRRVARPQKGLRKGFGLTVTEAMWKGTAVIEGTVGGIRHQVKDGTNGGLVDSVDTAAEQIRETVRECSLLPLSDASNHLPAFRLTHHSSSLRTSGHANGTLGRYVVNAA